MTETVTHFICVKLEGNTINHEFCVKIPDSEVDGLYDAKKISINIKRKSEEERYILTDSFRGKLENKK